MSTSPSAPFCWWGISNGVYIPAFLLRYRGVSPSAKLCFARITKYCGESDTCFPAQETLADDLGVSIRSIGTYLAELETDGFIEIIRKGMGEVNHYRTLRHPLIQATFCGSPSDQDQQDTSDQDRKTSSDPSYSTEGSQSEGSQSPQTGSTDASDQTSGKEACWLIERVGRKPKPSERNALVKAGPFPVGADGFAAKLERVIEWAEKNSVKDWVARFSSNPRKWFEDELRGVGKPRVERPSVKQPTEDPGNALAVSERSEMDADQQFSDYIRTYTLAGKAINPTKHSIPAWRKWKTMTPAQRDGAMRDAQRQALQTKEGKFLPTPFDHLATDPWETVAIPRALPVIDQSEAKYDPNQHAREIHYRKHPEDRPQARRV